LEAGQTYKIAVLDADESEAGNSEADRTTEATSARTDTQAGAPQHSHAGGKGEQPPVEEGELREVEIEDVGEQGDGLARIPPGYVVFVEDTQPGDRVRIEITEARDNFAFAEVRSRF
jgi:predicted RNA-binding protein with TRAM domain